MRYAAFAFFLCGIVSSVALAQPHAVTDPVPGATHCALVVDGSVWQDVPVVDGACKIDVTGMTTGVHRVQIIVVRIDANGRTAGDPYPPQPLCALVTKPSTTSMRVAWANVVACTRTGGCRNPCI